MTPNEREELARLLPAPVERDLPGDRHHLLQEFVMREIQRDPHPPRRPLMRRTVLVTSALTAVAAVAATVGIAATGTKPDADRTPPAPKALSGPELLLAAANTALRQPAGTGKYWHVTTVQRDATRNVKRNGTTETWTDRDGVNWIRFAEGMPDPNDTDKRIYTPFKWNSDGFPLTLVPVTFAQIQGLPATPDALTAWIAGILPPSDADGPLDAGDRAKYVLYGLVAVVSQLPAAPAVRAAAFQAIAAYPGVVNLGPVEGGQALQIPVFSGEQARLVVDPVAAQVRETNLLVQVHSVALQVDGGSSTITAEWTDTLPT